jgi:hypothetical protein
MVNKVLRAEIIARGRVRVESKGQLWFPRPLPDRKLAVAKIWRKKAAVSGG